METVRSIMKDIRNGEEFTKGFLRITYYNETRDTFLVDSFYNGTDKREELSAGTVRKIIKENLWNNVLMLVMD